MTIPEIYKKYDIMPTLQEHQYRVAAVAKILCERSSINLPKTEIISSCLLHDMGNLIKFNLDKIPEGLDIGDVAYWKQIQTVMKNKYGEDEHVATYEIAKEVGVSTNILNIIKNMGASHTREMLEQKNLVVLIATYSDLRVTPTGVTSLEMRINDLLKRYEGTAKYEGYKKGAVVFYEIEELLRESLKLEDLEIKTEEISLAISQLRDFVLM